MNDRDKIKIIDCILSPKAIAIVGASEKGGYPSQILQNLKKFQYQGKIFPVNPKRDEVYGIKCYPTISSIPDEVDLAVIIIPRRFVLNVMKECNQKGIKGVIIITSGFQEADEDGQNLHKQMKKFIAEASLGVVGPNCAGFASINHDTVLTLLEPEPLKGNVSFISQSGAMMMAIFGIFRDKEVGLNYIISTGNQMDLEVTDFIHYAVEDDSTDVITTFIEGIRDADQFLIAADKALQKGKPIIALKIGKTQKGREAASTHTGALAGSDVVFDAVFKQKGIIRVQDLDEMVDLSKVFSVFTRRNPGQGRIGIISQSGGMASLTADLASEIGLELPPFSPKTQENLLGMEHLLTFGFIANPADVRGAGTSPGTLAKTVEPILEDEQIDILVILLARSAVRERDLATAHEIIEVTQKTKKPVFVVWPGRRVPDPDVKLDDCPYRVLEKSQVPFFFTSRACIHAIKKYVDYHHFRRDLL